MAAVHLPLIPYPRLPWNVDNAVKTTIKMNIPTEVNGIKFLCRSGILFIKLPSGRTLSYVKPRIGENWYRKDAFANDIWIPHMEQLPGYNMDAFREEYLNMQILRKMLEEFRKNDNTKH